MTRAGNPAQAVKEATSPDILRLRNGVDVLDLGLRRSLTGTCNRPYPVPDVRHRRRSNHDMNHGDVRMATGGGFKFP